MAKQPHLSAHQQKIVKRYYAHRDDLSVQKLQELVSELYLAQGKTADKLWERVGLALAKLDLDAAKVQRVLGARDVKALAEMVMKLK